MIWMQGTHTHTERPRKWKWNVMSGDRRKEKIWPLATSWRPALDCSLWFMCDKSTLRLNSAQCGKIHEFLSLSVSLCLTVIIFIGRLQLIFILIKIYAVTETWLQLSHSTNGNEKLCWQLFFAFGLHRDNFDICSMWFQFGRRDLPSRNIYSNLWPELFYCCLCVFVFFFRQFSWVFYFCSLKLTCF